MFRLLLQFVSNSLSFGLTVHSIICEVVLCSGVCNLSASVAVATIQVRAGALTDDMVWQCSRSSYTRLQQRKSPDNNLIWPRQNPVVQSNSVHLLKYNMRYLYFIWFFPFYATLYRKKYYLFTSLHSVTFQIQSNNTKCNHTNRYYTSIKPYWSSAVYKVIHYINMDINTLKSAPFTSCNIKVMNTLIHQ